MSTNEQIRQFLVTNFYLPDPSVLSDDTSLLDAGVIDSTGVLEVISFLEDTFALSVEEEEMTPENLDSIARLSAYVAQKCAAAPLQSGPTVISTNPRGQECSLETA